MGVLGTTKVLVNGKVDTIANFHGISENVFTLVDRGSDLGTASILRLDNSVDSSISDIVFTGLISGTTFTISVDVAARFLDQDFEEIETLEVGDVVYGTYELFEVISITAGTPSNTTYMLEVEGGTSPDYCLVESGILVV